MGERIEDGGPAFPGAIDARSRDFTMPAEGMSLRQWYAGTALAGLLSNPALTFMGDDVLVAKSFTLADAMLAARPASRESGR